MKHYDEVLEDLRLLTNYRMDSDNRPCLLLVGLTELRRRLSMAVHESLAQRIVVRYHPAGLEREELPEYLAHRLRLAGCELPLFEPPAIEALFQATQGMPRKINRLGPLCPHQCRHRQGPVRCHRACPGRSRGARTMSTLASRFTLPLPDHRTSEQALAVYELLNDLAAAIWNCYEIDLLALIVPELDENPAAQSDLFDCDNQPLF